MDIAPQEIPGGQPKKNIKPNNQKPNPNANYPSASLYVGDLHPDVTEAFLYEIFKETGSIVSIRVCRDAVTRTSLGYAYVNFGNPKDASRALESLNYTVINDKPIRIMWSQRDPTVRKTGAGNVFIKNLDVGIDNKALYDTFSAFGKILSCKVQHKPGRETGVGYVHFISLEAATKAIEKVDGMLLNGKKVTVEHYKRTPKNRINDTNFTNVYVKNLVKEIDSEKLKELFSQFGKIQNAAVMLGRNGESKGFGFVNYFEHEAAHKAVEVMQDNEEHSAPEKKLFLCRAMTKQERMRHLREKFSKEGPPLYKNPGTNVYVKHLDENIDDEKLKEMFSKFGKITSCVVMKDDKTDISKGFGFVNFSKSEEATRAITEMNDKMVGAKPLYVALAQPKEVRRQQMMNRFRRLPQQQGVPFSSSPGSPIFYPNQGGPGMRTQNFGGHGGQQNWMRGGGGGGGRNFGGQRGMRQHGGGNYGGKHYHRQQHHKQRFHQHQHQHQQHQHQHHQRMSPQNMQRMPQNMQRIPQIQNRPPPQRQMEHRGAPQPNQMIPDQGRPRPQVQPQQIPQQVVQQPSHDQIPQPGTGVTPQNQQISASMLSELSKKDQKHLLGENLFPLVYQSCQGSQEEAGKITGMLLEMENTDLLHLLETTDELHAKVKEARELLRAHEEKVKGQ